ncbi:hypothetical protein Hamer_G028562 [Homarus americanus]|uniref:Uncharacterized protein n=1 Tax=Homarus americanus TaxID=6706 RepID=A0A8J5T145_HOMAM|nr:hypothetical protein Hamer_G028562 [Homarus americanus]
MAESVEQGSTIVGDTLVERLEEALLINARQYSALEESQTQVKELKQELQELKQELQHAKNQDTDLGQVEWLLKQDGHRVEAALSRMEYSVEQRVLQELDSKKMWDWNTLKQALTKFDTGQNTLRDNNMLDRPARDQYQRLIEPRGTIVGTRRTEDRVGARGGRKITLKVGQEMNGADIVGRIPIVRIIAPPDPGQVHVTRA